MGDLISLAQKAGKARVLAVAALLIALVAFTDWKVGNSVSLGVLYILPTMIGAFVLRPVGTTGVSILCAALRAKFDTPGSRAEIILRFLFALIAYLICGLFVNAIVRNRELMLRHFSNIQREQELRREAQEQLNVLVESSPAAILTLDGKGVVLGANRAANSLLAIADGDTLAGRSIAPYLPVLYDALRLQIGPEEFRTAAQCQGRKENGELFLGHTWFSSYHTKAGGHLAAIVVDSSEEMREREEENLTYLAKYNRIAASAVSHEVLNLCGAIYICCAALRDKHHLRDDEEYSRLVGLIRGLEKIASLELHSRSHEELEPVPVKAVLDSLRIIVEPEWREAGATIVWPDKDAAPSVLAESHGLLQALLNLVHNSFRAMQQSPKRQLSISVSVADRKAFIRLRDWGPGIASPERLFQPFQAGADGAGLGLYISRAILRSYAGDLRFEPQPDGSCFLLELQLV